MAAAAPVAAATAAAKAAAGRPNMDASACHIKTFTDEELEAASAKIAEEVGRRVGARLGPTAIPAARQEWLGREARRAASSGSAA